MSEKMRAVVFVGPRQAEIRNLDIPEPKEGEVLIRVRACNICTTEQGQYLGTRPNKYPIIGGHEFGGDIVKINSKEETNLKVGDRVSLGYVYCGTCDYCKQGLYTLCPELYKDDVRYGEYRGFFAFADYLTAPINTVYKFTSDLPYKKIGFEEPLGTVVHGQKKLNIKAGQYVVVFGAGTMGLLNAIYAKTQGAIVISVDLNNDKLARAKKAGINYVINSKEVDAKAEIMKITGNLGADVAIIAVGATPVNNQAVDIVRNQGKVLFFAAGYPKPEITVDPNELHYSEKQLIGTYGGDPEDFIMSNRLLDSGNVDVSPLLDEEYDCEDFKEALEKSVDGNHYRITMNF